MTNKQIEEACEISRKIKKIESDIKGLDFHRNFSQPTKLSIHKRFGVFVSRIFQSRPYETEIDEDETRMIIQFLQAHRMKSVSLLKDRLEQL